MIYLVFYQILTDFFPRGTFKTFEMFKMFKMREASEMLKTFTTQITLILRTLITR